MAEKSLCLSLDLGPQQICLSEVSEWRLKIYGQHVAFVQPYRVFLHCKNAAQYSPLINVAQPEMDIPP